MIRGPQRQTDYWTASRWLPLGVSAVVIGLLAVWLLRALEDVEARAEKLMVELTVRNIRTGLQLALGEALLHGREREIAGWAGVNPLRWLGREPPGYRGECTTRQAQGLEAGAWCFDRERRELAYRPRHAVRLKVEGGDGEAKVLRWRVVAAHGGSGLDAGLRVEYVTAYEWILE